MSLIGIKGVESSETNRKCQVYHFYPSYWSLSFSVPTSKVLEASGVGSLEGLACLAAAVGMVGEGTAAHNGVLFSFITRWGVDFLSESSTFAGGGCGAPFSALLAPHEACEWPDAPMPEGSQSAELDIGLVSDTMLCSIHSFH